MALFGLIWIIGVTMTVPISADRYTAPLPLKWTITIGHLLAVGAMFSPARGKASLRRTPIAIGAGIMGAWAAMQVAVMWYWN